MNIKKLIPNWSEISFSSANIDQLQIDDDTKKIIYKEFLELNIRDLNMDGFCTEGLPKTSETGSGLNYSKISYKSIPGLIFIYS